MIYAAVITFAVAGAYLAWLIRTAPLGFEDEQYGFRYGEEEDGQ